MNSTIRSTSTLGHGSTRCASHFDRMAAAKEARTKIPKTCFGTDVPLGALAEAQHAERKRIAQELHDTLLQGFLAVSMQLHAAVDRLPADHAETRLFTDILQLTNRVLDEGRCALQALRLPNGHASSLGEAFSHVPNNLGFPSKVDFRVIVLGREKELRDGLLDEVYRIGREAIANACLHSRATEIETEVEYRPTELRIAVRDNGCGINSRVLRTGQNGHWGLQGMRERAERIGARLRLWSRTALGTEVELCVPGRLAFVPMEGRAAR
jgi:signal transduction histidine kinase